MTKEEAIKIIDCYDIGFYDLNGEKIPADKLVEAFDMAIEALKAQENMIPLDGEDIMFVTTEEYKEHEWIPVSERPPEEKGKYIISYTYGVDIAEYNPDMYRDSIWSRDNILFKHNSVIAWMPLPKPYREEIEE